MVPDGLIITDLGFLMQVGPVVGPFESEPDGEGSLKETYRLLLIPKAAGGNPVFFRENPAEIAGIIEAHGIGDFGNA